VCAFFRHSYLPGELVGGLSKRLVLNMDRVRKIASATRDEAFVETILSIPRGKVASYGQVAAAAGYPRYHRAVARLLKTPLTTMIPGKLPWQRVLGAGGEIKLSGSAAAEQRLRLRMEGVTFVGKRVDLNRHQHVFGLESTSPEKARHLRSR
jgi:methylated-DNA-protein-cysteine methyltransferase related protein